MIRTPSRSFARLAVVAIAARHPVARACSTASQRPAERRAAAQPAGGTAVGIGRGSTSPSTITVGVLRPGATQEAADALNLQINQFEAKYPWITVEPEEYNWTAPTFTAALAAGTLPDVFTIPFTDGKGLIAQHQIVEHRLARSARCRTSTSSTRTSSSTARTPTARSGPSRPRPTACR